jgi:large subunit ribosomal protein L22
MTGPKRNEGATKVGERVGTRAQVRYVRSSATKAREVLDLIRGKSVREADSILQFTERDIAIVIRKALASAVANAQHNDGQDPEELYIAACFADEGPTLKRFRPRARGRATRVRKRTCHITVLVARMSDTALEQLRRKEERQPAAGRRGRIGGRAATSRRERVARSRQQAAAAQGHDHEHDHDHDHDDDDVEVGEPTPEMVQEAEEAVGVTAATEAEEIGDGVEIAAETDDVDDDVEPGEPTPEMVAEAEEADQVTEAEEADDVATATEASTDDDADDAAEDENTKGDA